MDHLKLAKYLHTCPHAEYLVEGFSNGFLLNFDGPEASIHSTPAHSIQENLHVARQKIDHEIKLGRVAGPFQKPPFQNFKASPLALRQKQDTGKFRLLHNLSYPYDDKSVNYNIPKQYTEVHYESLAHAISNIHQCSPNACLAKTDISDAFRLIPLHPSQYHLTGFYFDGAYYYDKCLPQGCASSCKIFETFSTSLKWILNNTFQVTRVVKVLDDFLFIEDNMTICHKSISHFIQLRDELCIPLAPHKTIMPTRNITFLGIQLDTQNMIAYLPQEKLQKYTSDLQHVLASRKITLRDLKSLIGKLSFATSVITSGRAFLRRLHDITIGIKKPHHFIRLNRATKSDLHMWLQFLTHYNGRSILYPPSTSNSAALHFYSDASKTGYGAAYGTDWIHGLWPSSWTSYNIAVLEFYPIYIMTSMLAFKFANSFIVFHTDNQALVEIINRQTSKCPQIMSISLCACPFKA